MSYSPSNMQLKLLPDSSADELERKNWKKIQRGRLINSLNRINFNDEEITLTFKHRKYDRILTLSAKPQPCKDNILICIFSDPEQAEQADQALRAYAFQHFYFTDGLRKVLVEAELEDITARNIKFNLPEISYEIYSRKTRRHGCNSITVQLSQDGLIVEGTLENFSAVAFAVNVAPDFKNDLQHIKQGSTFHTILKKDEVFCYSGTCEISRMSSSGEDFTIVLKPLKDEINRHNSKRYRSLRQKIKPMPNVAFNHPLIGKNIYLKVHDISGSGFSVEEDSENSNLIPGLIIPEMTLELMNNMELKCQAQVMYRCADAGEKIQCGFAFRDIGLKDQVILSSLLHQAWNEKAYVCTKIDVDELWDFFFETDFIYPEKYSSIYANKEEFKKVYKKLYENNPEFAINFICKDNNAISAHMSMFRFYDKTWIINHHAASSTKNKRGGLIVLEQVSRYINEFHQFNSSVMNYVGCYYRPENKFPNLVFGGVEKNTADLTSCSIDQFAYIPINKKYLNGSITGIWSLAEAQPADMRMLQDYYESISGGLSLQAMDLLPEKIGAEEGLNRIYRESGFKRDKFVFSLKKNDELIAVFMVNISDIGLNLSDLVNCIHIFILEPHSLPSDVLHAALSELSSYYQYDNIPVLIFPSSYTDNNAISINKIYNFWVLDVHKIGDRYFSYLDKLLRISK